jgi:hypothetical protein
VSRVLSSPWHRRAVVRRATRTNARDQQSGAAGEIQHKVESCLTPTSLSWADPIEAQFGPLRAFTMAYSDYPNHVVLARDLQAYCAGATPTPATPT